jgi:hypothetical protein
LVEARLRWIMLSRAGLLCILAPRLNAILNSCHQTVYPPCASAWLISAGQSAIPLLGCLLTPPSAVLERSQYLTRPPSPFQSIISLALSRLPQPSIRPLLILHPLGHRLVIASPILQSAGCFFLDPVSLSFSLVRAQECSVPFPIGCAPISRLAPTACHAPPQPFATAALFSFKDAYSRFKRQSDQRRSRKGRPRRETWRLYTAEIEAGLSWEPLGSIEVG